MARAAHEAQHDASAHGGAGSIDDGDIESYDRLNREFHERIHRATHNDFMAEQALGIRARLDAFRRGQLRYGDRIVASREEHGLILVAMAEGDGDLAGRRMRAHMLNAASALKRYIAERVSTVKGVESDVIHRVDGSSDANS